MEPKICGIYKITNPKKKIYIGQSRDIFHRWRNYKNLDCKYQKKLQRSFLKYGVEKHKFEILIQCEIEKLNELEKYYVDLFQTFNNKYGLNIQDGGGSKAAISDETRLKMKLSHRKYNTTETRGKISKSNKGKTKSDEHKKKLSIANTGYKLSEETKKKISEKLKLRIFTEEHKRKISEAKKGQTHTLETKQKISKLKKQRDYMNKLSNNQ